MSPSIPAVARAAGRGPCRDGQVRTLPRGAVLPGRHRGQELDHGGVARPGRGGAAARASGRCDSPASRGTRRRWRSPSGRWGRRLETDDPFQAEAHLGNALSIARGCGNAWIAALVQMSLASLRRRTSGAIDAAPILLDLLEVLSRASHRVASLAHLEAVRARRSATSATMRSVCSSRPGFTMRSSPCRRSPSTRLPPGRR